MPLLNVHKGSWFGLPDFGITEKLTSNRSSQGGSNLFGNNYASAPTNNSGFDILQQGSTQSVLGAANNTASPRAIAPKPAAPAPAPGPAPAPTGPSYTDLINQEYGATNDALNREEGMARGEYDRAVTNLQADKASAEADVRGEETIRNQELEGRRTQAGLDASQGVARVKQMLSELGNRNASYLAFTGGYGSNTAAALAEKFGRTAQSQMGDLEAAKNQTLNAITLEGQRVSNFFAKKLGEITTNFQRQKGDIEAQLNNRLNQIASLRDENRYNKARETMDAWREYASQVGNLRAQTLSFQQQLQAWALEKGQTLQEAKDFALQGTPTINPGEFGVMAPDQPIGGFATQQQAMNPIRINRATGAQPTEEEMRQQALLGLPSTVSQGFVA